MTGWAFFLKKRSKKTSVTVQDHRGAMFKKYDINQNIMITLTG